MGGAAWLLGRGLGAVAAFLGAGASGLLPVNAQQDFGDAPASYLTTQIAGGPFHFVSPSIYLGASVDGELDGVPGPLAQGDDTAGSSDEDGVQIYSSGPDRIVGLQVGAWSQLQALVHRRPVDLPAYLNVWIDFNRDGDFADANERVLTNVRVTDGLQQLGFFTPLTAVPGQTFARIRLGDLALAPGAGVGIGGFGGSGEVEDYRVEITDPSPASNIQVQERHGQRWITWQFNPATAAQVYEVYWMPVLVGSTVGMPLVASLFPDDYCGPRLVRQLNDAFGAAANVNFTIPDAAGNGTTTLAANRGLCVQTVRTTIAAGYYAVVPRGTTLVTAANRSAFVPLTIASLLEDGRPRPILQQSGVVNGGNHRVTFYTFWADGDDDPDAGRLDFPVMGNSARRGIPHHFMLVNPLPAPTNGPQPLMFSMHGGNGSANHWMPGGTTWNREGGHLNQGYSVGLEDQVPHILMGRPQASTSRWLGWIPTWDPFDNNPALPADSERIQPYTLKRLNWLKAWLLTQSGLNIDSARVSVRGMSLGAVGAMLWAHTFPDQFSHLTMHVPPLHWSHIWPDREPLFGTDAQNLRIDGLTNAAGNTLRYRNTMSLVDSLPAGKEPPPTKIYSGKRDEWWSIDYEGDFVPDTLQDIEEADLAVNALGVQFWWDQRPHGVEAWTLAEAGNPPQICPDYSAADFWIPSVATQTRRDDAEAHFRYRNDQSFPAFFSLQANIGMHDDPGSVEYNGVPFQQITEREGAPYQGQNDPCNPGLPVVTGDRRGTWGGYFDWFTDDGPEAPRDDVRTWAASVTLVNGVDAGGRAVATIDNAPTNVLSARIAIRRARDFKPAPGTPFFWMTASRTSGQITQSGIDTVPNQGAVRLPSIAIPRLPEVVRVLAATHADFGDAPAGYAVTLAENGALHALDSPLRLGSSRTVETNGVHTTNALSAAEIDDGVISPTVWRRGERVDLQIVVNQPCRLDAWVDWTQNQRWAGGVADLFDRVADSLPLLAGTNVIALTVPATATVGTTFARFRVSTAGGLAPTGPALDGEVEDYPIVVADPIQGPTIRLTTNLTGRVIARWQGDAGYSSQLEHSPNLRDWFKLDLPAPEANAIMSLEIPTPLLGTPEQFFRLARTPRVTSLIPTVPGRYPDQSFVHAGLARRYLLQIPQGWNTATNWPLVVVLPGHGQSLDEFIALHQELLDLANTDGWILVMAEATAGNDSNLWFTYAPPAAGQPYIDDATFLETMISQLVASTLNIDSRRVYGAGFSNGGSMMHYLASRSSHPFAAFAMIECGTAIIEKYPAPYDRLNPTVGTNVPARVDPPWQARPILLMNMATSVPWPFAGSGEITNLHARGARENVSRWTLANGWGRPVTNGLRVIGPPPALSSTTSNWVAAGNARARVAYEDIRPDSNWPTNLVANGWTLADALRFPYAGLVGTNLVDQRLPAWVRTSYPHTLVPDPAAPTNFVRVNAGTMTTEVWRAAPLNRTNEVIFIGLSDGGHQWPTAADRLPFDASVEVLRFFGAH